MTFLLGLLAAKGLGALIGSIVLLAQPLPGFVDPALSVGGDTIYLAVNLRNGFGRDLDALIASGTVIAVGYTVTLRAREPGSRALSTATVEFHHSAVYDPVERSYAVYRSEFAGTPDSLLTVETLAEVHALLTRARAPVTRTRALPAASEVSARVTAALNTVVIEAMNDREFDLNTFWNYRYPRAETPWLRLAP